MLDLREGLRRAERHLSELRSVFSSYKHISTFKTVREEQPLHGRVVIRLYSPVASIEFALILGDFIYNTRSALDRLAWDLSRLTMPVPPEQVMFPIHKRLDDMSAFSRKVQGIPPAAVAEIRELQPDRLGDEFRLDPLWQLNSLSNIAKHRTFAVSASEVDAYIQPRGYTQRVLSDCVEYAWPIRLKDEVRVEGFSMSFLFGKPVEFPGDDLEITEDQLIEMHRYVRDDVAPRFEQFFA
jgi:hypothetical protein